MVRWSDSRKRHLTKNHLTKDQSEGDSVGYTP